MFQLILKKYLHHPLIVLPAYNEKIRAQSPHIAFGLRVHRTSFRTVETVGELFDVGKGTDHSVKINESNEEQASD